MESPQWLEIRNKAFKMDPFHKGVSIYYVGVTDSEVCPVSSILNYRVYSVNTDYRHEPIIGTPRTNYRHVHAVKEGESVLRAL